MNNQEKLFHRSDSVPSVTARLIEMLDHIEKRVELLREHASAIESERDCLFTMLSNIKSNNDLDFLSEAEKEEVDLTTERLLSRTLSVEVTVTTPRNEIQQKALEHVNKYYDDLLVSMKSDQENTKVALQHYINACLSDCKGPIHQKFQAAVLECTADDQKRIRKRLENLMCAILVEERQNR